MVGFGLFDGLERGFQVGARGQRDGVELVERHDGVLEFEGARDVELVDGRAVVQQSQQRDFRGARVDDGGLVVGFVLRSLEDEAVEIDAGDVAGLEALTIDGQLLVEVIEVVLRGGQ